MSDMVTLKIDDQEVTVPKGMMVIEAAAKLGIFVPRYCYHPKLVPVANCRICLVEVEKARTPLVTACSTPVADGMVVWSNNQKVFEGRRAIIEFLLLNHPLDCPICDKGGECDLQDFSTAYGRMGSRFTDVKRTFEKTYHGPFIEFEMNRCISCMRCVRYCDEVMDVKALGAEGRGLMTRIVPAFGQELSCEFCGGCIQVCPVGALLSRWDMYEFRPWQLKETKTTCTYCADGCQLTLESRVDPKDQRAKVARVTSQWGQGRNDGDLCGKGFFGYQFITSPKRLLQPLIRERDPVAGVPGKTRTREVTMDDAIEAAAHRLLEIKVRDGGGAIAGVISARCTNEDLYLFQKFMRLTVGTNNVDSSARYGHLNAVLAFSRTFGVMRPLVSYEDILTSQVLLLIGADITETNPIVALKVKKAVKFHGARLITVDPYHCPPSSKSQVSTLATAHLQIHEGAERDAIYGLIKGLCAEGIPDRAAPPHASRYVQKVSDQVKKMSWKAIAESTGVGEEMWRKAASLFASAGRAVIIVGKGVTERSKGYESLVNLSDFLILSGKAGHEGCGILPLAEENNEQGAAVLGCDPAFLPGLAPVSDPSHRERCARVWKDAPPPDPGATLPEILEKAKRGEIKALYLVGENPLGTLPEAHVRQALEKLELLICQDLFVTETGELADIVLPASSFAEKSGTFTNLEGMVQKVQAALDPAGESLPDWEIFSSLSREMGYPLEYGSPQEILTEISSLVPGFASPRPPSWADHEGHLSHYISQGYAEDVEERYRTPPTPPSPSKNGLFRLHRGPVLFHSGKLSLRNEPLTLLCPEGRLFMNPADLTRLGLVDGDRAVVKADGREVAVPVSSDPKYPEGTLFFPEHFDDPPVKDLMPLEIDPTTKVLYTKDAHVTVEKEKRKA